MTTETLAAFRHFSDCLNSKLEKARHPAETLALISVKECVDGTIAEIAKDSTGEARSGERPTRLPDDFTVHESDLVWADNNGVDRETCAHETEKFVDYFRSAVGAKALKRDWRATWRNWIRRHRQFERTGRSGSPQGLYSGARRDLS